jgi:hypothetical protein
LMVTITQGFGCIGQKATREPSRSAHDQPAASETR